MIASPAPEEEAARYTNIAATSAVICKVSVIPTCDEGEEHDGGLKRGKGREGEGRMGGKERRGEGREIGGRRRRKRGGKKRR